jgi:cytochrome c oxidase subunit 3
MQFIEYSEASFRLADGVYGTTFFITTGFHGFHVTVGAIFLLVVSVNLYQGKLLFNHHFSFESAAWY